MLEIGHPDRFSDGSEAVEIAVADLVPILEFDAELERRVCRADERLLVDAKQAVKGARGGNGGFPHADGADIVGFYEGDVDQLPKLLDERGCRDPAGGAAAG